jgi:hypothetical protein
MIKMSLENLNLKKGILRLFIVSIVGAPIYGLFNGMEQMANSSYLLNQSKDALIKQVNDPRCEIVLKGFIIETNPWDNSKHKLDCSTLEIYSDSLLKYQKENLKKYPEVSELLVRDYISKESRTTDFRVWLQNSIEPVFYVLAFWFISYFGFRILRWVYKGFKG